MQKIVLLLLLSFFSVVVPAYSQNADEDFCDRFPLNSRCTQESPESKVAPLDKNIAGDNNIVESLTLEEVENYLREIGYINIKRNENNSISFLMQGRPCYVFLSPKGTGIIVSSFFSKTEQMTLEALNGWNKGFKYSYAYLYETQDAKEMVFLDTNLTLIGGVTEERIRNFFLLHSAYQTNFERYLNGL